MALLGYILAAETVEHRLELGRVPSGWLALGSVVLLGLLLYAVVFFYRREQRAGASRRLRLLMAGIRCAVVVLLAVVWLEPVIATYIQRRIESQTLVLVDGSASMGLKDRYPVAASATLAAQALRGGDPKAVTRAELADRVLTRDGDALLQKLADSNPVRVYQFGDKLSFVGALAANSREGEKETGGDGEKKSGRAGEKDRGGEGERGRGGAPGAQTKPAGVGSTVEESIAAGLAKAQAPATDIGRAVRAAIEAQAGAPIAGIVVLSDGRFNQGEPAEIVGRYARSRKIPIYAVGVGDPSPPRSVTVSAIEAPPNVFVKDPFKVVAHLRAEGLDGSALTVQLLERPGGADHASVTESKRVVVRPGGAIDPVTFDRQIAQASEVTLQVRVIPEAGEILGDTNPKETTVRALEAKMRVLLVAGGPTWEYRYLARLLQRDATVNVSCWLQSADENAVRDGTTVIDHLPRTQQELFQYDCIILLDPAPGDIDPAWVTNVEALVGSYGGGLLYVAGRKNAARFAHDPNARGVLDLLPVVIDPNESDLMINELGHFQTTAWPVAVPPEAAGNPVLALSDQPGENLQIWSRLPGVYWHYPVRREKPVATVLLRHSSPQMRNSYGGHVLLATQFFGSGRTGFLGFDSTWRWRRYGDRYFNRFWIQLLRHLVEGKLLTGQKRGLIQVERDTYSVGEAVVVEARLLDSRHLPMAAPQVAGTVHVEGQPDRQVTLAAQPNRPGWYRGQFVPTDVGTHVLQIDLPGGDGVAPASIRSEVRVGQPDLEFRQPQLDRESLTSLAVQSGGGKYLEVSEAEQLPELIPSRTTTLVLTGQPITLWDRWWTLLALAGLLTAEWSLRKWGRLL